MTMMRHDSPILFGVGEVLWDVFPAFRRLGGAPANVVMNWTRLGGEGRLLSAVGEDEPGEAIREELRRRGIDPADLQTNARPTGRVDVELDTHGGPTYTIVKNVAWDHLQARPDDLQAVADADAIVFGTLAQRAEESRRAIRALVDACTGLRVYDVNLRGWDDDTAEIVAASLDRANVLKLNEDELQTLAEPFALPEASIEEQLATLAERHDLRLIALTLGKAGCLLFAGEIAADPGRTVATDNTVGAGDAFTAALLWHFLSGADLDTVARLANAHAAEVIRRA